MDDVEIRLATAADAAAIADVHVDSWGHAYRGLIDDAYLDAFIAGRAARAERWATILAEQPAADRTWLALRDGRVIGFCGTGPGVDEDAAPGTGQVFALYLAPSIEGQGVGRRLFAHAVADLRGRGFGPLTLWVLRENERARRFYAAAGWTPDGAEKVEERPGVRLAEVRYSAE
jgi:GNAT superfamily N-acetyltransferase